MGSVSAELEFSSDWKNNLTERLLQFDRLFAELNKYRTAAAVLLEMGHHLPVIDEHDIEEIRTLVALLVEAIDMQILMEFIRK